MRVLTRWISRHAYHTVDEQESTSKAGLRFTPFTVLGVNSYCEIGGGKN